MFLESIQKHILEECLDNLGNIMKEIGENKLDNEIKKCEEVIYQKIKNWIQSPNSSSILRDSLRRLR